MKGVLILVSLWLVGCNTQVSTTPIGIKYATEVCASHGGIVDVSQYQQTFIFNDFIQAACKDGFVFKIYHTKYLKVKNEL